MCRDIQHRGDRAATRGGFSLVEVSLAILVVGLGLIVIFGLFPSGLRSSEEADKDTRTALFADWLFNAMAANAGTITDWSEWSDPAIVRTRCVQGLGGIVADGTVRPAYPFPEEWPAPPDTIVHWVRYRINIVPGGAGHTIYVEVSDGRYGPFPQASYCAAILFSGMPP
jgi:hypothetical protein